MKVKRTITIEGNELVQFLKEKFDITGTSIADIELHALTHMMTKVELRQITIEWTEDTDRQRDTWSR